MRLYDSLTDTFCFKFVVTDPPRCQICVDLGSSQVQSRKILTTAIEAMDTAQQRLAVIRGQLSGDDTLSVRATSYGNRTVNDELLCSIALPETLDSTDWQVHR